MQRNKYALENLTVSRMNVLVILLLIFVAVFVSVVYEY